MEIHYLGSFLHVKICISLQMAHGSRRDKQAFGNSDKRASCKRAQAGKPKVATRRLIIWGDSALLLFLTRHYWVHGYAGKQRRECLLKHADKTLSCRPTVCMPFLEFGDQPCNPFLQAARCVSIVIRSFSAPRAC